MFSKTMYVILATIYVWGKYYKNAYLCDADKVEETCEKLRKENSELVEIEVVKILVSDKEDTARTVKNFLETLEK